MCATSLELYIVKINCGPVAHISGRLVYLEDMYAHIGADSISVLLAGIACIVVAGRTTLTDGVLILSV